MSVFFILHWCKRVLAHFEISSIEFFVNVLSQENNENWAFSAICHYHGYVIDHKC